MTSRFENNNEISAYTMNKFVEVHRGYLLKEIINTPIESVDRFRWTIQSGGLLWDPIKSSYVDSFDKDPKEIISKPHVVGITREIELARRGSWSSSWVGLLFNYHLPQLGFSRGEQRLLFAALSGVTDADLASDLGVSVSTVKNTWRSIYNRVASRRPELIPDHSHENAQNSDRGREKRRQLLAYLREHPEELRPVSQKLLGRAKAPRGRAH